MLKDFIIQNPNAIYILPLLFVAYFFAHKLFFEMKRVIAEIDSSEKVISLSHKKNELIFLIISIFFLNILFFEFSWEPVPKKVLQEGRDVIFLLDVSKSMLATDIMPNRLEYSKNVIKECVESFDNDNVALVVFAGSASIKCPLTNDYEFFYSIMSNVNSESVASGGTRIGDAVKKVLDKLINKRNSHTQKDIILITDGDDQDSQTVKIIDKLNEQKIGLIVIGIGDTKTGSRIEVEEKGQKQFMLYKGEEVWARMNPEILEKFASRSDSFVFINAGLKSFVLSDIYKRITEGKEKQALDSQTKVMYLPKYKSLTFIILILLLLRMFFIFRFNQKIKKTLLVFLSLFALNSQLLAESQDEFIENAKQQVVEEDDVDPVETYNSACLVAEQGDYDTAFSLFSDAVTYSKTPELKLKAYYNKGCAGYKYAEKFYKMNPDLALEFINDSIDAFKLARAINPNFINASYNLELIYKLKDRVTKFRDEEIAKLREFLKKVRVVLDQLNAEYKVIVDYTSLFVSKSSIDTNKTTLINDITKTNSVVKSNYSSLVEISKNIPFPEKKWIQYTTKEIIDKSVEHLSVAVSNEEEVKRNLLNTEFKGDYSQMSVHNALMISSIRLLSEFFQTNTNSSEDSSEDSEELMNEKDGDMKSDDQNGTLDAYNETNQIPPPIDNPEDIFAEEKKNNSMRSGKKNKNYIKVERDW